MVMPACLYQGWACADRVPSRGTPATSPAGGAGRPAEWTSGRTKAPTLSASFRPSLELVVFLDERFEFLQPPSDLLPHIIDH
jgi:hypothetical protein